ncbi:hypothetical protein N0V91_010527 [Didymella pomorum]|uniref:Secreted protein n=1 Tax=Didymella pomorum TaxID=749634 RepID=A0A9W8Z711_9PLEO|nr:hypothetical protein N0V91_010527 [Didymella pomorum]
MFLGLFVPSGLTALFTMTSATPILSKDAAQSVCGTIDLKNGVSQMLFETCNALVEPELDDSIQNAKGYFCQKS